MLRLLAVVAGLAVASCTCTPPCELASCGGCCAEGVCQAGLSDTACGSAGLACEACSAGSVCSSGVCKMPTAAGGGGAGAAGGGVAGGGGGGTFGAGGGGGAGGGCFEDTDCPDPHLFFCNTTTSLCEPSCHNKAECGAAVRGPFALNYCDATPLGCNCDNGTCVPALCSADSDCGGLVCRNGQCVTPAVGAARCQVIPDYAVMRGLTPTQFSVIAWDATGAPVVPLTPPTWSAVFTSVVSLGNGRFMGASTPTPSNEIDLVQATFGGVQCFARGIILPDAVDAGQLAVVAWDEATGRPIAGAKVVLSSPADGGVIGTPALTDTRGFAQVSASPPVSVTVMSPDFDYQTIVAYTPSTGTAARMLAFPLRRNPFDRNGGATGTMTNVPASSNVHMGWASVAQRNFHELAPQAPDVVTHVQIGSAVDTNAPLPTRSYLGFTNQTSKPTWSALGPSGVCFIDGGVPDDVAMASGACGTGALWGYGADVPLGDLPIDALAGGLANINWGQVLARIAPLTLKARSVVQRDVSWTRAVTPASIDGGLDLTGTAGFTAQDLPFGQVPLAFPMTLRVPALPQRGGQFADTVWLRGFAQVPGRGLVDLGLGDAVNTNPPDQSTDLQQGYMSAGLAQLRMAPTHHGLEGSQYVVTATAYFGRELPTASSGAGVVLPVPLNHLVFDPSGATPLVMPGFLPFAEHGRFSGRAFSFSSAPAVGAATEARVVFTTATGTRWVVRFDPATAAQGLALPVPPSPLADRSTWDGTPARAAMAVQLLQLEDAMPISFTRLAELDGTDADRLADFTKAWSTLDLGRPSIGWKSPAVSGVTLSAGSPVTVHVGGFTVGPDGFVRLTFGGAPGCGQVDIMADVSGVGDVQLGIPGACTGTGLTLTATLYDASSVPLPGPISASIVATIQ